MPSMSLEERAQLISASLAAGKAGNKDEEIRLMRKLPLAPHLAMAAKEMYGKEYLLEHGYDLTDANEEFGNDWLER